MREFTGFAPREKEHDTSCLPNECRCDVAIQENFSVEIINFGVGNRERNLPQDQSKAHIGNKGFAICSADGALAHSNANREERRKKP